MKKLFEVKVTVSNREYPICYQFISAREAFRFAEQAEKLAGVKAATEPDWPTAIYDGKNAAEKAFDNLLVMVS